MVQIGTLLNPDHSLSDKFRAEDRSSENDLLLKIAVDRKRLTLKVDHSYK